MTTRLAYASSTAASAAPSERTLPPVAPGPGRGRPAAAAAEGPEEHVRERAVHGLAHHPREQRAGGADERARDDQQVVVQDEAGGGRRDAGERVQQRDHDGHVGAADRQHEEHAEQQRERAGRDEARLAVAEADARREDRRTAAAIRPLTAFWPG